MTTDNHRTFVVGSQKSFDEWRLRNDIPKKFNGVMHIRSVHDVFGLRPSASENDQSIVVLHDADEDAVIELRRRGFKTP